VRRGVSGRVTALIVVLSVLSLAIVALSGLPSPAQVVDPTTTTVPPDTTTTTVPPTTTTTVPPTTTTTVPPTTTTTVAPTDTTTTTVPAPDTTTAPPPPSTSGIPTELLALLAQVGNLDPGEQHVPEFPALSDYQRGLVQTLQTATDTYAVLRFALVDLAHQVSVAKDLLKEARAAENAAVENELFGLAEAALSPKDDTALAVSLPDVPESIRSASAADHQQSQDARLDNRLAAFRTLSRHLEADRKKAQLVRVQIQARVAALSARPAAQTQALADASAARAAAESAIEQELGSDAVRARPDAITATLATAQAGQPDPIVIGGFGQPIPGAALTSPFGLRNDPLSNGAGFHPGVDFGAGSGTPIHAAAAGVVVTAGDCGGYGNCVVIDHGGSLATVYGHQSELLVQVGEHVDEGQVIGLVGSTGASTGPHLHFEVRLHGLPIDPLLALLPA
jgi:murein DD-endopeptidase MepM/ murein hydrolase activator NlpD